MRKDNLDADGNIQISSDEAKNGCIHKLRINDDAPINLVIPPGTKHEQVMRLKGKGNFQPQTGRRGDLYITVYIDGIPRTSTVKVNNYARGAVILKKSQKITIALLGIVLVGGVSVSQNGNYFVNLSSNPLEETIPLEVKVDSKYPFAETCSDMQDAYNKHYEEGYNDGTYKIKYTFSLFGENRFRGDAYADAGLCSKGVISKSADTYDEICTNSNMFYIWKISKDTPVPEYGFGYASGGSTESCIRT